MQIKSLFHANSRIFLQIYLHIFTINENGDQVVFSRGNLQATTNDLGANWTWGFAENQWDYIGNAAANNPAKTASFVQK